MYMSLANGEKHCKWMYRSNQLQNRFLCLTFSQQEIFQVPSRLDSASMGISGEMA